MAAKGRNMKKRDKKYGDFDQDLTNSESDRSLNTMFPELMAVEELIQVLKERGVFISEEEVGDKSKLVELYRRAVMPMPQRKYRLNRRGKDATKNQIIRAKKRKSEDSDPNPSFSIHSPKSEKAEPGSRFLSSYNISSSSGERLKPPPLKSERKIISLKSSSRPLQSGVDHIKINTISKTNQSPPTPKSPPNPKSPNPKSPSSDSPKEVHMSSPKILTNNEQKKKIIRLNRTSFGSESEIKDHSPDINPPEKKVKVEEKAEILPDQTKKVSTSETGTDDEVSTKFKKVSITWP